ncbi:MAG: hypothetical protein ACK2U1_24890, partial [Anaerolineales bacterium]
IECASCILINFKMTRRGLFHSTRLDENLRRCWNAVGNDLMGINKLVLESVWWSHRAGHILGDI